jgi:hypothetical protein
VKSPARGARNVLIGENNIVLGTFAVDQRDLHDLSFGR